MNDLIKELKQAAGIDYNPDQEGLDLFAKLIIEQCGVALSPMLRDMISRGHGVDLINKHFGIEE
jgi:hypothetical protein